jgi:glycerol-3-phosphate acyltransferase PlsY
VIWEIVLICILFAIIGYLFGSVIFGAIISMIAKKDIRKTGSKNIGGTNVSRIMGKPIGLLVSVLDAIKGYLAIIVC